MLISDPKMIGNRLFALRKQLGYTQLEVAEAANIGQRTYADIERGSAGMRIHTLVAICNVLQITPDEILTDDASMPAMDPAELFEKLNACPHKHQRTALTLLTTYLDSLS